MGEAFYRRYAEESRKIKENFPTLTLQNTITVTSQEQITVDFVYKDWFRNKIPKIHLKLNKCDHLEKSKQEIEHELEHELQIYAWSLEDLKTPVLPLIIERMFNLIPSPTIPTQTQTENTTTMKKIKVSSRSTSPKQKQKTVVTDKSSKEKNTVDTKKETLKSQKSYIKETIYDARWDKSPEVCRDKSPIFRRGKSLEVPRDKSPNVHRDKSPNVHRDKSPNVHRDKSPNVRRGKSPEVHRDKSPDVQGETSAVKEQSKSPDAERRKSPDAQSEKYDDDDQGKASTYRPPPLTYFLAVRCSNPEIGDAFEKIVKEIISHNPVYHEVCCRREELHITLCVFSEKSENLIKALQDMKDEIITHAPKQLMKIEGLSEFSDGRIVFAKVYSQELVNFQNWLVKKLEEAGIGIGSSEYTPHMSIGKIVHSFLRKNKDVTNIPEHVYSKVKDIKLGEQGVEGIYLCEFGKKRQEDGFYSSLWEIHFT